MFMCDRRDLSNLTYLGDLSHLSGLSNRSDLEVFTSVP